MISARVVPNMKNGGSGVMVWGYFAGDTVGDLFRIQGTLNQHGITDYKGKHRRELPSEKSLPDELNNFYARFEARNKQH